MPFLSISVAQHELLYLSIDASTLTSIYLIHISLQQPLSAAETKKKEKKRTETVEQKLIRETRGSFSQSRRIKFSN